MSVDSSSTESKEPQENQANVERYLGEKDRYKEFLVNGPMNKGSTNDRQIQETLNKTNGQVSAGKGEGKGRDPGWSLINFLLIFIEKGLRTNIDLSYAKGNSKI